MEWLKVVSKCNTYGYDAITCEILDSHNITTGGAQVPIVIFLLSLMVVCKMIALKDDIMHNHWGSISADEISQLFTKLEHFTFLMTLSKDVIEATWYFSIPFCCQTQILTHNTSKIFLKL